MSCRCCRWRRRSRRRRGAAPAPSVTAERYRVEGMDCAACAQTVEKVGRRARRRPRRAGVVRQRDAGRRGRRRARPACRPRSRAPATARAPLTRRRRASRPRRSGGATRARSRRVASVVLLAVAVVGDAGGRVARGRRAAVPALDGRRRLADRPRGAGGAAAPLAGHERADDARGRRRGRHRLLRRGRVGAGAVRGRHDARDLRVRPQPPLGRAS